MKGISFNKIISPTRKNQFQIFSQKGRRIHVICRLFFEVDPKKITQEMLVDISKELEEKNSYTQSEFKAIKDTAEISNAKKKKNKIEPERVQEILACLEEILNLRGINIENITPIKDGLSVKFTYDKKKAVDFASITRINTTILKHYGLLNILDTEPLIQIKSWLVKAAELRVLQSCLYNFEGSWEEILKDALEHGNLRKIKFLFAQPYSVAANERAHTISPKNEDPIEYFTHRTQGIIGGIVNLAKKYNGRIKKGVNEPYHIEIRLYYRPCSIPIYQCLDQNGNNLMTFFGIFWQHISSLKAPHFQISGLGGKLVEMITAHFKQIWEDYYEDKKTQNEKSVQALNWHQIGGAQKTISMDLSSSNTHLFKKLKEAYRLKSFSNYTRATPEWIYFVCYYHNREKKPRAFLLQVDPTKRIVKVKHTARGNIYYGTLTKLHSSYSIFLHNVTPNATERIISLNVYVGAKGFDNEDNFFGVYNNNDPITGFPYAQVMILKKVREEDLNNINDEKYFDKINKEDNFPNDLPEIKKYAPTLREKMIDLQNELSHLNDKTNRLGGNYTFRFEDRKKNEFYKRLKDEIRFANHEIYFLGHGPIHFPNASDRFMPEYFEDHLSLLKKGVRMYRLLLNAEVDQSFVESLKVIKSQSKIRDLYKLYVPFHPPIPMVADLVLIDPDESAQTAILTYTRTKMRGNERLTYPIKIEVRRESKDISVIKDFHETCREYMNADKLMRELNTVEEIEEYFSGKKS